MKYTVAMRVNGQPRELLMEGRRTLLDALRNDVGLMGTKEGCGNGNCGSCTVLLNGRPILSCLAFAVEAEGAEILTIEGVAADGRLHPIQQAFVDHGGLQCGICTPGFIMSAKALLDGNPRPSDHEVRAAIAGNLCRCTGYDKIVRAILACAEMGAMAKRGAGGSRGSADA